MKKEINSHVIVKEANLHNLKNLSINIPKHKLVVFTGVSGSGKSSLIFDTVYTEAQRQLIETFSTFARRRLPKLSRPDVKEINNISTTIIIDQKRLGSNSRSTVGTATELYTHLKLLFSRIGEPYIGPSFLFGFNHPEGMCPRCKGLGKRIKVDTDLLIEYEKSIEEGAINHPEFKQGGWNWREIMVLDLFDTTKAIKDYSESELNLLLYSESIPIEKPHGVSTYMKNWEGIVTKLERRYLNKDEINLSKERKNAFDKYFNFFECDSCHGSRINKKAREVRINGISIDQLSKMELSELDHFLSKIENPLAVPIVQKMRSILSHLIEIGVGYLSLSRETGSLSGGESQRVKMARQLDCTLTELIYILDEPSIGLHPKDTKKLIDMLYHIKDRGNSVYVVEHDTDIIKSGEWIIDIGPEAGVNGGEIMFEGPYDELKKSDTITGKFLNQKYPINTNPRKFKSFFEIKNANIHNLKNLNIKIPANIFTCVTGVAGSGKSSLIFDIFLKQINNAIIIDQSAVGRSIRSNPATYTGMFSEIRKEFAKATSSNPSLFSFNSKGACPKCKGNGYISVEMSFMDDITIECDKCEGKKYKKEILDLKYKGKSIYDVLEMSIEDASRFFETKSIFKRLKILNEVGLGYLKIGQPLSTLSGGEAQRIKLSSELHKSGSIYVMDEPTTGLHMHDISHLLKIINKLVNHGNTVIVIEHNTDIIKNADWVIDLGPEGGKKGGEIIFEGRPADILKCKKSHTAKFLK